MCFVSRVVYIEIVNLFEIDSFFNVFCCFIVCCGLVWEIWCDNGINFVGVEREFCEVLKEMNYDELIEKFC